MNKKIKTGLMVGRFQPFHKGHSQVIHEMIQDCENVVIGIGSTNSDNTERNPLSSGIRETMLKSVFGNRIKSIPLEDINAETKEEWCNYVLNEAYQRTGLTPDHYFSGSKENADYFIPCFGLENITIVENNGLSATYIRQMLKEQDEQWRNYVPSINHDIVNMFLRGANNG